jgi:hypothetical protein
MSLNEVRTARREMIQKLIAEADGLREELYRKRLYSGDPKERARSKNDVAELKELVKELEAELKELELSTS